MNERCLNNKSMYKSLFIKIYARSKTLVAQFSSFLFVNHEPFSKISQEDILVHSTQQLNDTFISSQRCGH